jgi:hypothetical protein
LPAVKMRAPKIKPLRSSIRKGSRQGKKVAETEEA